MKFVSREHQARRLKAINVMLLMRTMGTCSRDENISTIARQLEWAARFRMTCA